MKNIKYILLTTGLLIPLVSSAQQFQGLKGLLISFRDILSLLVPVVFGICLIFFFWGLSQFILHAGDEKTREDGKKKMLWGIIALFVFVSIYGLINMIGSLTGIGPNSRNPIQGGLNSDDLGCDPSDDPFNPNPCM